MNAHFQRLAAVDHVKALDDMELFCMWSPKIVDIGFAVDANCIDNKGIVFVVPN